MYPSPQHFIVRPGPPGRGDIIVPLIAIDQLPDWIQLAGVPRQLDVDQAVGLINLGDFAGNEVSLYEVRLRADRIRAIMRGEAGEEEEEEEEKPLAPNDSISKKEKVPKVTASGSLKQANEVEAEGTQDEEVEDIQEEAISRERTATKATEAILPPLVPEARAWDEESDVASADMVSAGPKKQSKSVKQQQEGNASREIEQPPPEPMLSASRHNTTAKAAGENPAKTAKPIRPHLTEEMQDTRARRVVVPRIKDKCFSAKSDTNYCRHWCHHGTCKWGSECRYLHRMPTNEEGLRDVGLKHFPTWYLLMMAGSGFPGMEGLNSTLGLHSGLNIGLNAMGSSMGHPSARNNNTNNLLSRLVRNPYPANPFVHAPTHPQTNAFPLHISPMDLRLKQGRMSALLAGSAVMTHRPKLRQTKEMHEMLLRTNDVPEHHNNNANLSPRLDNIQARQHHHGRANLHTNASVAANAAKLSAASRRQALREAERGAVAPVETPFKVRAGERRTSGSFDEMEGRLSPVGSDMERDGRRNTMVLEGRLVDID